MFFWHIKIKGQLLSRSNLRGKQTVSGKLRNHFHLKKTLCLFSACRVSLSIILSPRTCYQDPGLSGIHLTICIDEDETLMLHTLLTPHNHHTVLTSSNRAHSDSSLEMNEAHQPLLHSSSSSHSPYTHHTHYIVLTSSNRAQPDSPLDL